MTNSLQLRLIGSRLINAIIESGIDTSIDYRVKGNVRLLSAYIYLADNKTAMFDISSRVSYTKNSKLSLDLIELMNQNAGYELYEKLADEYRSTN